MPNVTNDQLKFLAEFIKTGDERRRAMTSNLLTIYAALTSGLFIFVSNSSAKIPNRGDKYLLLATSLTSVCIVLVASLEKIIDYFGTAQGGKKYAEHLREGKPTHRKSFGPNKITSFALKAIPLCLFVLVILNALSVGLYIYVRIIR